MAETSNSTTPKRTSAARKSTGTTRKGSGTTSTGTTRTSTGTTRTSTGTRRSTTRTTAATSPSTTTARRARTTAARETREAAGANARAAKVTGEQGRSVAARAALVYVGATLTARDRAIGIVGELRKELRGLRTVATRKGAEQRIAGYERRGTKARTQLGRDVRRARTRVEHELTTRRRHAERFVRRAERTAERRPNVVAGRIARAETAVQAGVAAGERLAATAKERVSAIA